MPRRAARILALTIIAIIILATLILSYTMYMTAGDYSGKVQLTKLDGGYTIESILIKARPERLQGDYQATLVFHVKTTIEGPRTSLQPSEAEELARRQVEVTCPAQYEYHVGAPRAVEKVTAGPLSKTTFSIPVYITIKDSMIRLEPGKEAQVYIELRPGCIILHRHIEPTILLDPLHGGPTIDIKDITITRGE